jgi:hypothetical protein
MYTVWSNGPSWHSRFEYHRREVTCIKLCSEMRKKLETLTEDEDRQRWSYFFVFCICCFRWLFLTEDDIKGLPCFQVGLYLMKKIPYCSFLKVHPFLTFHTRFDYDRNYFWIFILYLHHGWYYLYRLLNYVVSLYSLCNMQNQTLNAIKAPHGTSVEVPHPDDEVRSQ